MMYGYPPPPGAVQHHPGNPQAPPMPMYWHPSWGPPPPFEGRWMMPPPLPGQETQYDHLRRPGEPVPKRRRMTEGMSTEGEEGKIAKKKIDVACRFCRERKLRCDGNRPQCGNCSLRERDCFYQPGPPNRRGPGRKSKQMASGGASTGPNSPLAPISTITSQISTSPRTSASQPPSPTKPVQFRMENGQKKKEK
ncbi:hypothetical protein CALCODRAFT_495460 [Calocera cornea HHB12733]|uniref:Zn(2)-C6 fungal-type domain-containing protein n=1 Tax=Calocera cornea HHB12733 TaxID=1353952 RepID=A0A165GF18_9BASI|nr:hypothetical protein CALCODRAFT_495460 [Calocera cornea HHB12733]